MTMWTRKMWKTEPAPGSWVMTLIGGLAVFLVPLVPPAGSSAATQQPATASEDLALLEVAQHPARATLLPTEVEWLEEEPVLNPQPLEEPTSCPLGWRSLGQHRLTAYVMAAEEEFDASEQVEDPCGLAGSFSRAFLYGSGVRMQGSGRARDGSIVHYRGKGCFERLSCAKTASGVCAQAGRTVAVDRSLIPLGSRLWIQGLGERVAEDTGGGIRGQHIDVYYGEELTMRQAQTRSRRGREVCVRDDSIASI